MRIIHIADIHWRGLSRHDEYRETFDQFFKQARDLKPDIIYVGGDIVHSKTQGISPELIDSLCWWFQGLSDIAPTHVILGNHDGLVLNKDRQDEISPIIDALNNPNIFSKYFLITDCTSCFLFKIERYFVEIEFESSLLEDG